MADPRMLMALAGPSRAGEPNPLGSFVMMGLIFAIFYFVLILPMRRKTAESDVESTRIEGTNPAMTKALDVLLDQATRSSASIYTIDSSAEITVLS